MKSRDSLILIVAVPVLLFVGWALRPLGSWVSSWSWCDECPACARCEAMTLTQAAPEYTARKTADGAVFICADDTALFATDGKRMVRVDGTCPPAAAPAPAAAVPASPSPEPYLPLPRKTAP